MNTKSKGFTLIELLVVVAIIGVLSTVVLASLSSTKTKALEAHYKQDMNAMRKTLEIYRLDNGTYPVVSFWLGIARNFGSKTTSGPNAYIPGLVPNYILELPAVDGSIGSSAIGYAYRGGSTGYKFIFHQPDKLNLSLPLIGDNLYDNQRPTWSWQICAEDVPGTWCNL
jgi:prepilin-type N-terminal cleavage/methylation domain-containing protein